VVVYVFSLRSGRLLSLLSPSVVSPLLSGCLLHGRKIGLLVFLLFV